MRENAEELVLIDKAARGDLDAFNHLVLKYQDRLYNHAYGLLGDWQLADDVTQESLIKAFQRLTGFRGGSFRAWLLQIVTNACYDVGRSQRRHPTVLLSPPDEDGEEIESAPWMADPGPSVEALVERNALAARIHDALQKLPDSFRSVVTLVDLQELDYEEAAFVLKIPVGTVRSRLARARLRLRQMLAPAHETEYRSALSGMTEPTRFANL